MRQKLKKQGYFWLSLTIFLVTSLPLILSRINEKQSRLPLASEKPANIIVDPTVKQGKVNGFWQALAQGGEERSEKVLELQEVYRLWAMRGCVRAESDCL